ncbi:hypothetical protein [Streptosporangium sp. NPDC001681]
MRPRAINGLPKPSRAQRVPSAMPVKTNFAADSPIHSRTGYPAKVA